MYNLDCAASMALRVPTATLADQIIDDVMPPCKQQRRVFVCKRYGLDPLARTRVDIEPYAFLKQREGLINRMREMLLYIFADRMTMQSCTHSCLLSGYEIPFDLLICIVPSLRTRDLLSFARTSRVMRCLVHRLDVLRAHFTRNRIPHIMAGAWADLDRAACERLDKIARRVGRDETRTVAFRALCHEVERRYGSWESFLRHLENKSAWNLLNSQLPSCWEL